MWGMHHCSKTFGGGNVFRPQHQFWFIEELNARVTLLFNVTTFPNRIGSLNEILSTEAVTTILLNDVERQSQKQYPSNASNVHPLSYWACLYRLVKPTCQVLYKWVTWFLSFSHSYRYSLKCLPLIVVECPMTDVRWSTSHTSVIGRFSIRFRPAKGTKAK